MKQTPAQRRHSEYAWLRRTLMGAQIQLYKQAGNQTFSAELRKRLDDASNLLLVLAADVRREELTK